VTAQKAGKQFAWQAFVPTTVAKGVLTKVVGDIPQRFHCLRLNGDIGMIDDHRHSAMLVYDVRERIGS
jgi:hypothetical protein